MSDLLNSNGLAPFVYACVPFHFRIKG